MSGERWRARIREALSHHDPLAFACECGKTREAHQAHGNGPVSAEEREMDHGDHDGATGAERGEG